MSIHYNKEKQVISLNTVNSTYQMGIGKYGFLLHLYYGKKIEGDMSYLLNYHDTGIMEMETFEAYALMLKTKTECMAVI
jgi:hypothetical protein